MGGQGLEEVGREGERVGKRKGREHDPLSTPPKLACMAEQRK